MEIKVKQTFQFFVSFRLPICDTHVFRVSHRLGLSDGSTPRAVELDLEQYIPEDRRAISHHWLILHGRYVCTARAPRCSACGLQPWCRDFARKQPEIKKDL